MNYIALTLGPIEKTILQAHRCREMWSSSYLFSYIMKKILQRIDVKPQFEAILPILDPADRHPNPGIKKGAGIYPDRLMIRVKDYEQSSYDDFLIILQEVIKEISNISGLSILFLKNYLHLYSFQREITQDYLKQNNITLVKYLNDLLDTLELINIPKLYNFSEFEDKIFNTANTNFLAIDGIPTEEWMNVDNNNIARFSSISEIACVEFNRRSPQVFNNLVQQLVLTNKKDNNEDQFINKIQDEWPNIFKQYHKYYAVVHSDGDGIGAILQEIGNDIPLLKLFSIFLQDFAKDACDEIKLYGGLPIYIGGDDLVFFAPIIMPSEFYGGEDRIQSSIFDLCLKIDAIFKNHFLQFKAINNISPTINVTLSWGICISYHKYPLKESYLASQQMLFDIAKKTSEKNAIGIKFLKHSGQSMQAIISKTKKPSFENLMKFFSPQSSIGSSESFISSINYKIADFHPLFKVLSKKDPENKLNRWSNFFNETFNEDKHKQSEIKDFLTNARELCTSVYANYTELLPVVENRESHFNECAFQNIYTALRFFHFINGNEI